MNLNTISDSTNNLFMIDCKDVILREYREEDMQELHAITQQPEVLEYLPWWEHTIEQRFYWFLNYESKDNQQFYQAITKGEDLGSLYLRLIIISKETGEIIGCCGTGIKEELPPPNREIFYIISNKYANRGFTTQAVQGFTKYLFHNTNLEELCAIALERNIASNRVIQKCGFDFLSSIDLDQENYYYYKLFKNSTMC
ncbi:N-acetyltransferase [Paenibacillus albiflavus]|uniref:N-acetyltransferase n=1 Tax=Paenibacillus albiflavus TaxID=2545760 RepID=A0A4R4EMS4_9BACL|nr:GNAT family N-acetyltransferase [Paenibacillus albiflavus]TCZ80863.1 N-acetyltransferase [Paenibacillus albiflavus]